MREVEAGEGEKKNREGKFNSLEVTKVMRHHDNFISKHITAALHAAAKTYKQILL